jgi:hypothetical protein
VEGSHPLSSLLLAALMIASCAKPSPPQPSTPVSSPGFPVEIFETAPLESAADADKPFEETERYTVLVAGRETPVTVSSCRALAEVARTAVDVEPSDELTLQTFWSRAVDCEAAKLLRAAQRSRESRIAELLQAQNPSALLPPELGLTDFADERARVSAASAKCTVWRTYDASLRLEPRSPRTFSIRSDGWSGVLIFYARADFDGDGFEDVLIRRNGKADGGSYAASALFILSRTAHDECVHVSSAFGRS